MLCRFPAYVSLSIYISLLLFCLFLLLVYYLYLYIKKSCTYMCVQCTFSLPPHSLNISTNDQYFQSNPSVLISSSKKQYLTVSIHISILIEIQKTLGIHTNKQLTLSRNFISGRYAVYQLIKFGGLKKLTGFKSLLYIWKVNIGDLFLLSSFNIPYCSRVKFSWWLVPTLHSQISTS